MSDLAGKVALVTGGGAGIGHSTALAFNNAGIEGHMLPTADLPDEEVRRVIDVDLFGVLYGMKHEIPAMLARGGGTIVSTSSTAGLRG